MLVLLLIRRKKANKLSSTLRAYNKGNVKYHFTFLNKLGCVMDSITVTFTRITDGTIEEMVNAISLL